jgi:hypothetical protein
MMPDVAPTDGVDALQPEPQFVPPHVSLKGEHEMAADSEYRPLAQSEHVPFPARPLYFPAEQLLHEVAARAPTHSIAPSGS